MNIPLDCKCSVSVSYFCSPLAILLRTSDLPGKFPLFPSFLFILGVEFYKLIGITKDDEIDTFYLGQVLPRKVYGKISKKPH